jgi:hypothetical protein
MTEPTPSKVRKVERRLSNLWTDEKGMFSQSKIMLWITWLAFLAAVLGITARAMFSAWSIKPVAAALVLGGLFGLLGLCLFNRHDSRAFTIKASAKGAEITVGEEYDNGA